MDKNNISYGGTHSAWQGIVRGGTFCDGYSAANALLCAYAGVDSVSVVGTIPQGPHAWNWVRIGEKWYTSDSTANNLSDGAFLLRSDENGKDTFYVLDEEQEPPEIQAQYPRYSVGYKDELEKGNKIDSGRVGDNLIWTLREGVLTISGEGEMRDFEDPYLVPWRSSTEYIKKVVIKEGVTSIGANAFCDLENIKKDDPDTADIAGSVETVGEHAFYDPNDPVTEFASRLELKSNLTIQYGGARLTKNDVIQEGFYGNTEAENSDFEFKYSADNGANWTSGLPENVGTYVIEATLKAKNTGGLTYHSSTETAAVTITKADFHVTSIHAKAGRYYDGTTDVDIESAFADYSHWNNQNLRLGVDYKITAQYVSPEAGTGKAYITVTPLDTVRMNNYNVTYSKDAVSTYYNIRKKPLEVDMFEPIPAQPFTGGQERPLVTIASSEEAIMTYDDFTVSYEKNVDPGTGYVVVTGKNNYTDEVRIPFEIDDSLQVEPTITPMNSSGVVIKGFNYPETFKVQLQQVQDQAGQAVNLYYLENGNSLSSEPLATAAVNADGAAEFTVNSGDKKMLAGPQTLVAMSAANEELARVSVVLNAVKVTATPSGDILALKMYDGTTKVLTEEEGGRRYDVKLDLSNIVEGDDVSASFDCEYSTPDIGANMLLFTNIKLTGKDFAYYHLTNTQANFGDPSGSSIEQLGGQVWIYRADLTPVITLGEKIYDGTSDVPITEINWEGLVGDHTLRQTTDYTLEASYDETDAGEQTITVAIKLLETPAAAYYRLADEYFESFEITGTIKQKALTEDMFADIGEQAYTGKKIEPAVKAADTEPLLTDENYTVSYGENISGSGTVTITGRKNYTGEVTLTFPITDGVAKPDSNFA